MNKYSKIKAISLFSGTGGMDLGFAQSGYQIVWANDSDKSACENYSANSLGQIKHGKLESFIQDVSLLPSTETTAVFGGPPCQGFSVAGKMNPYDDRSEHVWNFLSVVEKSRPTAFVMENVKALAVNSRWQDVRIALAEKATSLGYESNIFVLRASDFGVPQNRERMFFVGVRGRDIGELNSLLEAQKQHAKTVRDTLSVLDEAGTGNNQRLCNAKITLAAKPILRKSPFAGNFFNGAGRPINLDGFANTLPASMGGNKTPIIDPVYLADQNAGSWIFDYHTHLIDGGEPFDWQACPSHLRRITVDEAKLIQGFSQDFILPASNSVAYRLIGNSVPPSLAMGVAKALEELLTI